MTYYQQQYPPQGYGPPLQQQQNNGIATGGFITALVGAVLALIPIVGIVSWIISPIGLVLSIIGLTAASKRGGIGRGLAISGIVLGALGLLICIIYAAAFSAMFQQGFNNGYNGTSASSPSYSLPTAQAPTTATAAGPLILEVTGTVSRASVTHSNVTGGIATSQERLPFRTEVQDPGGYMTVSLSATPDFMSNRSGGTVTCTITQGGQVISTQTADGQYPSVFCMG